MFFFFNDTATTEIYTLSLHDALPICSNRLGKLRSGLRLAEGARPMVPVVAGPRSLRMSPNRLVAATTSKRPGCSTKDRKSTRLNSSHGYISYAVFCLKKKIAD